MHERKVIAVDFDGTICSEVANYPEVGEPVWPIINAAKEEKQKGNVIILWTTRSGVALQKAINACNSFGLEFDAINGTTQELIDAWDGEDPRKIGATEYWDDRAISPMEVIQRSQNRI